MKPLKLMLTFLLFLGGCLPALGQIHIIAAENNYGIIAKMIGGNRVYVDSIMNNPNQDPHLFSVAPNTIRLLSALKPEDLFIINGADYDSWAVNLETQTPAKTINVADLNHIKEGSNPHLWYDLTNINQLAIYLTQQLSAREPSNKAFFSKNLKQFLIQSEKIAKQINILRKKYNQRPITATEPVANYLTNALGLNMLNQHFQLSVMNDTQPSAQDRAQFLNDLRLHKVVLLIYNQQVNNPTTIMMQKMAKQANIPVVGVNELAPANTQNFLDWYQATLDKITQKL